MAGAKTCTLCGARKPIEQFYRDKSRPDGHKSHCRDCALNASKAYSKSPAGRKNSRERNRARRATGLAKPVPDERRQQEYADLKASPKYKARYTLRNHVANGRIIKPAACEDCGAGGQVHGHHHDYSKPLDVE